jgi:hypothetical protein
MTQPDPNDPYDFDVQVEETVTFLITTMGTNPHVVIAHGGTPLSPPYSFKIDKPVPNAHVVEAEFDFDSDAAANARYDILVQYPVLPSLHGKGLVRHHPS